jgi:hypothetical protein
MQGMVHPFTGALYEKDDRHPELVRVTLGGEYGLFRTDGQWVEGEIYDADPQLCGWIGGPKLLHHRLQA